MTIIRKALQQRQENTAVFRAAKKYGFTDLQCRVIAGRARRDEEELEHILFPALKNLHHPDKLKDSERAAELITAAICEKRRIGILTDYDVDGICSHVVVYEALKHFGVALDMVSSFIGHRMNDGYGISENLVDRILASAEKPRLIITADCGSSDEAQINRLKNSAIEVIVTDHHVIPHEGIPQSAAATVNPNRHDCSYPDKFISGCMVSWLLMCSVRNNLINKKYLPESTNKLSLLLDFVALSTVADAVSFFSATNRAVVNSGLAIINQRSKPSWCALASFINRPHSVPFTPEDLAFQVAPRVNARSRMADPYAALHFFLAETTENAATQLQKLEKNNEERKRTEKEMVQKAKTTARKLIGDGRRTLVVWDEAFHPGVQGIVASRLVDAYGRPSVVLSPTNGDNILSGSVRSIPEIHIRDVLQKIHDRYPRIFLSFGGHSGAAGLKIKKEDFAKFSLAFEESVRSEINNRQLDPIIVTDGKLAVDLMNFNTISQLQALGPYGREFDEPVFEGIFTVKKYRLVGAEPVHLTLNLEAEDKRQLNGIWFRALEKPGDDIQINNENTIRCAYKLKLNNFRGHKDIQLLIEYAEVVDEVREKNED